MTIMKSEKAKEQLKAAWEKHGDYHRVKNAGQTFFRKVDINYLRDRAKHVPAWALKPVKPEKKGKKGGKKGKKKK